jgi:hypothetical protein
MADTEPDKRWYERLLDDGTASIYAGGYEGDPGRFYYEQLRNGARAVGTGANAVVNGAYSVFPDTLDFARSALRAAGLFGKAEAGRFDQEMGAMGEGARQVVTHPRLAAQAAGNAWSAGWDPLLLPYLAGRGAMGYVTQLGPFALAGGVLRAAEDGHNLIDSVIYRGVQGRSPPAGLLGIQPEGSGLLAIRPQEQR